MSLVAKREESFSSVEVIKMNNELVNYLTFVHSESCQNLGFLSLTNDCVTS